FLTEDATGIRPQVNLDVGMGFPKDGEERRENSRCRPIGSTHHQWSASLLHRTLQIALIDLFELHQDRLDVLEKLITVVSKPDSFRVSCEQSKVESVFQRFQVLGERRLTYVQIVGGLSYVQMFC